MHWLKRVLAAIKKCDILEKWLNRISGEGLTEENGAEICTDDCALLPRFMGNLINGGKSTTKKMERNFEEKQKECVMVSHLV